MNCPICSKTLITNEFILAKTMEQYIDFICGGDYLCNHYCMRYQGNTLISINYEYDGYFIRDVVIDKTLTICKSKMKLGELSFNDKFNGAVDVPYFSTMNFSLDKLINKIKSYILFS